jgi:hypothetical protein
MAKSETEKRNRSSLTWIVTAGLLVIIILVIISNLGGNKTGRNTAVMVDTTYKMKQLSLDSTMKEKINGYISFIRDSSHGSNSYSFIKESLTKLSETVISMVERNDTLKANLSEAQDTLKGLISSINDYNRFKQSASLFRKIILTITEILGDAKTKYSAIQDRYPEIRKSAESIELNLTENEQEKRIINFFQLSAAVMQKLVSKR